MTTYAPPAQTIVTWTQPFATVGSWQRIQGSPGFGGGTYQSNGAMNDYVEYRVALNAGVNTITVIGVVASNYAISTVSLDGGVGTVGVLDWYAVGAADDTVKTITGVTVPFTGVYGLRFTAASKHASSSNYRQNFQFVAVHATTDISGPVVGATLPHRVDIIPWAGTQYAVSTAITRTQGSTYLGGGLAYTGTTINNYAEYLVALAAGTWSITTIHTTAADGGISTVSIDGASVGTFDLYSAGTVGNVVTPITGVVIPADGIYKLRFTAASKAGASSAYAQRMQLHTLQRTGS